jgi:ABC-2 type transport system ATP-binding protein
MSSVVEVRDLKKSYGNVTAIDNISFLIEEEKIYGLLGRNGAGKTTIMQMIAAQIFATSGELKVFGENPYENDRVLSQLCFIKESQKYPERFRVADVLDLSGSFFPNWDQEYATSLIEEFQLPLKRKMKELSRGMFSSVGIIIGLASRAPLTIFDEPYMGLDAVARSLFYDRLIEDYADHPRTVIFSTHLIDEVSRLLEHVIVIDRGKLILNEDVEVLRERAFTVVGPNARVEAFVVGKELIGREAFGSLTSATIIGVADRKQAEALGLEMAPVSLQQLVVHLTNGKSEKKVLEI